MKSVPQSEWSIIFLLQQTILRAYRYHKRDGSPHCWYSVSQLTLCCSERRQKFGTNSFTTRQPQTSWRLSKNVGALERLCHSWSTAKVQTWTWSGANDLLNKVWNPWWFACRWSLLLEGNKQRGQRHGLDWKEGRNEEGIQSKGGQLYITTQGWSLTSPHSANGKRANRIINTSDWHLTQSSLHNTSQPRTLSLVTQTRWGTGSFPMRLKAKFGPTVLLWLVCTDMENRAARQPAAQYLAHLNAVLCPTVCKILPSMWS